MKQHYRKKEIILKTIIMTENVWAWEVGKTFKIVIIIILYFVCL